MAFNRESVFVKAKRLFSDTVEIMIPQPLLPPPSSPSLNDQRKLTVWSPKTISLITFFLGCVAGVPLAALNWRRMGLKKKTNQYIIGSIILFIAALGSFFIPDNNISKICFVGINVGIMVFLNIETRREQEKMSPHTIKEASGVHAFFIGLAFLLAFIACTVAFIGLLSYVGIPLPQ